MKTDCHTAVRFILQKLLTKQNLYDKILKSHTEGYRSGHNEAVLKTVWAHAHKGSNPFPSANKKALKTLRFRGFLFWRVVRVEIYIGEYPEMIISLWFTS